MSRSTFGVHDYGHLAQSYPMEQEHYVEDLNKEVSSQEINASNNSATIHSKPLKLLQGLFRQRVVLPCATCVVRLY